jgi:hypothetical protein
MNKNKERKRRDLTLNKKKEIIQYYMSRKPSQRQLATIYDISLGTANSIIQNREAILQSSETNNKRKPNLYKTNSFDFELYEWFVAKRSILIPVSGDLIKEKARKMALKNGVENFASSARWLECFLKRYGISSKVLNGEENFVDLDSVTNFFNKNRNLIESYKKEDIYNCDETGLFFKAFDKKSYVLPNEDKKSGKYSKERKTVLLCCNAVGDKLSPFVIGKAVNPRCLKGINIKNLKMEYQNNSKAWMNCNLFCKWMNNLNNTMKSANRNILLILDNAPVHSRDKAFSNVKLLFLPRNTTSISQPLDQGIIRSFKQKYRNFLSRELLINENHSRMEFFASINLLKAFLLLTKAWAEVSKETIECCFCKSGVILKMKIIQLRKNFVLIMNHRMNFQFAKK